MADIDATTDVYCIDDFDPTMPTVSGRVALVQRLARRLQTPTGKFPFWDPDDGFDVLQVLLSKASPGFITSQVQIQCLKDEQVETCSATLILTAPNTYKLTVAVTDADGPFTFTMDISTAKESLTLKIQEAS